MPEICVVGSINLDIITYVDTYPEEEKQSLARRFLISPAVGSKPSYLLCASRKNSTFNRCSWTRQTW